MKLTEKIFGLLVLTAGILRAGTPLPAGPAAVPVPAPGRVEVVSPDLSVPAVVTGPPRVTVTPAVVTPNRAPTPVVVTPLPVPSPAPARATVTPAPAPAPAVLPAGLVCPGITTAQPLPPSPVPAGPVPPAIRRPLERGGFTHGLPGVLPGRRR